MKAHWVLLSYKKSCVLNKHTNLVRAVKNEPGLVFVQWNRQLTSLIFFHLAEIQLAFSNLATLFPTNTEWLNAGAQMCPGGYGSPLRRWHCGRWALKSLGDGPGTGCCGGKKQLVLKGLSQNIIDLKFIEQFWWNMLLDSANAIFSYYFLILFFSL